MKQDHVRSILSPGSLHPILIVEDNDIDFRQTIKAFKESHLGNPVYRCVDGDDALDFLHQRGKYSDPSTAPRPSIILLDLRMPGTDGKEVLREIKGNPDLRTIPVVVLTTSDAPVDVEACYAAGANSYVCKPVTFEGYLKAVRSLDEYWFHIAILPDVGEPQ
uniref:Response regulator n=1 Tax=Schlesneria paludicola TaxID=360056 RepID=A0A7C2JX92_9PLAN